MDVLGDNEDDAVEELNMPLDFPLINGTGGKHKNRPHLQKNVCINAMIFFFCISLNDKIINVLKC